MAYCTNCGAQLPDGASFCTQCGSQQSPFGGGVIPPGGASAEFNPYAIGASYNNSVTTVASYDPNAPIVPNFNEAISICFRKYAVFKGRASRSEFWYWHLFLFLVNFVVRIALNVATVSFRDAESYAFVGAVTIMSGVSLLFSLGVFLPTVSVFVRRMHDTNHSGWLWWFPFLAWIGVVLGSGIALATGSKTLQDPTSVYWVVAVIVIVGVVLALYPFILTLRRGDLGDNQYGAAPRAR